MTIKTKYVFVDGKSIELAFDEDNLAAAYILEDRRREKSLARKVRRHNYSLDAIKYEGKEYFTQKETPESMMIAREERDRLLEKMKLLTQAQRRRLFMRMQGVDCIIKLNNLIKIHSGASVVECKCTNHNHQRSHHHGSCIFYHN